MINIDDLNESIENGKIRITDHADEEAQNDALFLDEIFRSVKSGEVIEQYPDDKPYPSCLILGRSNISLPIHSVWAYNAETQSGVLITVYRPDPARWMTDMKTRRKR